MSANADKILEDALHLSPAERAALVEELFSSLDEPDNELDALWSKEAEVRIDSAERGEMKSIPASRVFSKYD